MVRLRAPSVGDASRGPVPALVQSELLDGGVAGISEAPVSDFAAEIGSTQVNERDERGNTEAGGKPPCIPITPGCPAHHSAV